MKILHLLNEIKFSGAEVMLKVAAPTFIEKRVDLHVLSTGEEIGDYAYILKNSGCTLHHIPFRKRINYFIDLYRLLQKEKFDVIHIHSERAFFWHGLIARIVRGDTVLIRTVHSVFRFSGFLRLKRMLQRVLARKVLGVRFVSISPSVAEVENKVFYNRTLLIWNWIDQDKFVPVQSAEVRIQLREKYGIRLEDVSLISVGSCIEEKNHKAIIAAVAEVEKEFKNIIYLHVGEGPLTKEERELVSKYGIEDRTVFLGQIEIVRDALVASDIFLMSSKYEGLPIAGLEAMSCGLPIIAYNVYGIKDIVEDGKNGLLIEPNTHALAACIKELIRNPIQRKRMGIEAHLSFLKKFDKERSLKRLLKVYKGDLVT